MTAYLAFGFCGLSLPLLLEAGGFVLDRLTCFAGAALANDWLRLFYAYLSVLLQLRDTHRDLYRRELLL
jgi:hypothetical protein